MIQLSHFTLNIYPPPFPQCLCTPPHYQKKGKKVIEIPILGHGLFPWQSSVVEGVHVDNLLCFHHDGRLELVFVPALALEGNPQFVHHGTAERSLQKNEKEKGEQNGFSHCLFVMDNRTSLFSLCAAWFLPQSQSTVSSQSSHRGKRSNIQCTSPGIEHMREREKQKKQNGKKCRTIDCVLDGKGVELLNILSEYINLYIYRPAAPQIQLSARQTGNLLHIIAAKIIDYMYDLRSMNFYVHYICV